MYKKVIFTGQAPSKYELNDICVVHTHELKQLQSIGRYNIEVLNDVKSNTPDDSWTNNEIRSYLDSEGIEYKARDSKTELLEAI